MLKMPLFAFFFEKNLVVSKKSITFASSNKNNNPFKQLRL